MPTGDQFPSLPDKNQLFGILNQSMKQNEDAVQKQAETAVSYVTAINNLATAINRLCDTLTNNSWGCK